MGKIGTKCSGIFTAAQDSDRLTVEKKHREKKKEKRLVVFAGAGRTFARGGATVVFEVGAVFTLVVFWASAVVVRGQVEAGRSILTRVGGAVIDIQLRAKRGKRKKKIQKRVLKRERLT